MNALANSCNSSSDTLRAYYKITKRILMLFTTFLVFRTAKKKNIKKKSIEPQTISHELSEGFH